MINTNSPRRNAMHDLSNYIIEKKISTFDGNYDAWFVTQKYLDTKENRKLNRLLGIHRVNKTSKNMRRNKPK